MQYPLISEYIEAIRSAEDNFDKLNNFRPVLDDYGNPIMSSGNFAVVFKMQDVNTGKFFAVKCFIKEQEGRGERYAKITEELAFVSSPYILHARYMEHELFVSTPGCDEEEFPVLVMDWVEGQPLDAYLRENLDDEYVLQMLAYRFCNMGAWLLSQPFAHGDLKPDNILVRDDGTLVLVDYDGMYVPSMKGEKAYEIGSPDFRHPQRTADDFDEHIDDFSIASIALSLKSIALDSQLYQKYAAADRLLFSTADYRDIGQSSALQAIVGLSSDADLPLLLGMFLLALSKNSLGLVSFRLLLLPEPQKLVVKETLSSEITDEERKNAVEDAFGATYTADGLKLIKVLTNGEEYVIKDGTKVIGNGAFRGCDSLTSITIPNSVTSIGNNAFRGCDSLTSITIPNSVRSIGEGAFYWCDSLTSITIPNSVTSIGGGIFQYCNILQNVILETSKFYVQDNILYSKEGRVISCWSSNPHIIIPQGVVSIGKAAFLACDSLTSITIPNSVRSIGKGAFLDCESLTSITIPNGVTSIGDIVFSGCDSLTSITIPNSVTSIGNGAFSRCGSLTSITISNSVTSIGNGAFSGCESLTSITIPNSVMSIGNSAFSVCKSLTSITIPNSVTSIGNGIFSGCKDLHNVILETSKFYVQDDILYSKEGRVISCWSSKSHVIISQGVTSIGEHAFRWCESLTLITIPNGVTSIGDSAFSGCKSLTSITIPNSVMSIGKSAFFWCDSLTSITIPNIVTSIGEDAFSGCVSLKSIRIPKGTRNMMLKLLGDWSNDKLVEI